MMGVGGRDFVRKSRLVVVGRRQWRGRLLPLEGRKRGSNNELFLGRGRRLDLGRRWRRLL